MKKFLAFLIITGLAVYGSYRLMMPLVTEHIVGQVSSEVLTGEVIEDLKNNPDVAEAIQKFEAEAAAGGSGKPENLPFNTKEEAVKVVVSKFSAGEITGISAKAARGLTNEEQKDLENLVMERLTPEEIEAILYIGLTELSEDLLSQ